MIKLEDITTRYFDSVSFEIKGGSVCKIITKSGDEKGVLLDTILGLQRPKGGIVFLFGKDIYSISEKECISLFKRIGVVFRDGGVISNLKVWENVTLPVCYHTGRRPEEMEERVIDIFKRMGKDISYISELMGKLPGPLSLHEKRLIGMVRAMLMEPELMIYDSIFEGLDPEKAGRLLGLTESFHSEKSDRASVYVTSNEQSVKGVKADTVFRP